MAAPIHVVTVGKDRKEGIELLARTAKDVEKEYTLIHVAHCEGINVVKHVLTSLVVAPGMLVCSPTIFEEEQEEIREIANRVIPDMKLVMIPNDLDLQKKGEDPVKGMVEFLREQVECRF